MPQGRRQWAGEYERAPSRRRTPSASARLREALLRRRLHRRRAARPARRARLRRARPQRDRARAAGHPRRRRRWRRWCGCSCCSSPVRARARAASRRCPSARTCLRATAGWCRDGADEVAGDRGRAAVRRARGPGLVHRLRPGLRGRRRRRHRRPSGTTRGRRPRRRRRVHDARRHHRAYARRLAPSTSVPAPASRRCTPPSTPPASPPPTSTPARCTSPALTLALSGAPEADLREGSLFEPVADDETYDLIVSNPPFVISPGARLTYRDGGMGGRRPVPHARSAGGRPAERRAATASSSPTGSTWRARTGSERLRSWVPRGCDAWIVQREVQDVTQYAELWLRDAGDHRARPGRVRGAVRRLAGRVRGAQGTKAVGFGWITLRKSGAEQPVRRRRGVAASRSSSRSVTTVRGALRAAGLSCARTTTRPCSPATSGWPTRSCRSRSGCPAPRTPSMWCCVRTAACGGPPRWTRSARGSRACATGRCRAGRILDAIAQLVGEDPVVLRDRTPEAIRLLVEQGFLEPVARSEPADAGRRPRASSRRRTPGSERGQGPASRSCPRPLQPDGRRSRVRVAGRAVDGVPLSGQGCCGPGGPRPDARPCLIRLRPGEVPRTSDWARCRRGPGSRKACRVTVRVAVAGFSRLTRGRDVPSHSAASAAKAA